MRLASERGFQACRCLDWGLLCGRSEPARTARSSPTAWVLIVFPPHTEGSVQCLIVAWAHSKVQCSPLGVEEWSRGPRGGESISQL